MGGSPVSGLPKRSVSWMRHWLLSAAAALAVLGAAAAAVQLYGRPEDAGPRVVLAMTWPQERSEGALRAALSDVIIPAEGDPELLEPATGGPDLADATLEPAPSAVVSSGRPAPAPPVRRGLPKAPVAGLTAPGPRGLLPVVRPDGMTAFRAYRRPPVERGVGPRIAVVVSGLGFNSAATQKAIDELPPEVTLSFVPYASNLQGWIDKARERGHEVLLELPMEPFDVAGIDTGPQTLLAGASEAQNTERLEDLLSRGVGYFAVTNYQGGRFANAKDASAGFAKALQSRGLGFIAAGLPQSAPLVGALRASAAPHAVSDRVLDVRRNAEAIAEQLESLETLARNGGDALGAGFAYPVTIDQIRLWSEGAAERGFQLVPASEIAERRGGR